VDEALAPHSGDFEYEIGSWPKHVSGRERMESVLVGVVPDLGRPSNDEADGVFTEDEWIPNRSPF